MLPAEGPAESLQLLVHFNCARLSAGHPLADKLYCLGFEETQRHALLLHLARREPALRHMIVSF
jgi:hypothetical protein